MLLSSSVHDLSFCTLSFGCVSFDVTVRLKRCREQHSASRFRGGTKGTNGLEVEVTKKKQRKDQIVATGHVIILKGKATQDGKHGMAIVAGFFSPKVNIREKGGNEGAHPGNNGRGRSCRSVRQGGQVQSIVRGRPQQNYCNDRSGDFFSNDQ
jgi:hypothetical protein